MRSAVICGWVVVAVAAAGWISIVAGSVALAIRRPVAGHRAPGVERSLSAQAGTA